MKKILLVFLFIIFVGVIENFIKTGSFIPEFYFITHQTLWFSLFITMCFLLFKKTIKEKEFYNFTMYFLFFPFLIRIFYLFSENKNITYMYAASLNEFIYNFFTLGLYTELHILLKLEVILLPVFCFLFLKFYFSKTYIKSFLYSIAFYSMLYFTANLNLIFHFFMLDNNLIIFSIYILSFFMTFDNNSMLKLSKLFIYLLFFLFLIFPTDSYSFFLTNHTIFALIALSLFFYFYKTSKISILFYLNKFLFLAYFLYIYRHYAYQIIIPISITVTILFFLKRKIKIEKLIFIFILLLFGIVKFYFIFNLFPDF